MWLPHLVLFPPNYGVLSFFPMPSPYKPLSFHETNSKIKISESTRTRKNPLLSLFTKMRDKIDCIHLQDVSFLSTLTFYPIFF
jgi:hypothetical protein